MSRHGAEKRRPALAIGSPRWREIGTLAAAAPGASATSTAIVGAYEDKSPFGISGRNSQICFIRFDAVPNHLLGDERRRSPRGLPLNPQSLSDDGVDAHRNDLHLILPLVSTV